MNRAADAAVTCYKNQKAKKRDENVFLIYIYIYIWKIQYFADYNKMTFNCKSISFNN